MRIDGLPRLRGLVYELYDHLKQNLCVGVMTIPDL